MSAPTLILCDGTAFEVNLNDAVNTFLQEGFAIPRAELSDRGQRKRERGIVPGPADYQRLNVTIPIRLTGTSVEDFVTHQRAIIQALNQPRPTLTWNPDPATCSDVIFDAYSGSLDIPLDFNYFVHHKTDALIDLLVDPSPYAAESTIFDTVAVLGQIDGEAGQWTCSQTGANAPYDSTRYRQGSKSARTEIKAAADSWILRTLAPPLDIITIFLGANKTGWVTALLHLDSVPDTLTSIDVTITDYDASENKYRITHPFGLASFVPGWQILFFDINAPFASSPFAGVLASILFTANVSSGDGPAFNIDNVHIANGKVCNVRGQTPLPITVYGVGGEYDCGFKADIRAGAGARTLSDGESPEAWTKTSGSGTVAISNFHFEGSKSVALDNSGYSTPNLIGYRSDAFSFDCSSFAVGTMSAWFMNPTGSSQISDFTIRVGNSSINYWYKTYSMSLGAAGVFQQLSWLFSDMTAVGSPNLSNPIQYVALVTGGYDYTVMDQLTFADLGSNLDLTTITEGSGIEAAPGVISLPESSPTAPAGHTWEATPAKTDLAGTFGGKYYRWTITVNTAEKYIFPAKLIGDLYAGEHNVSVRLRSSDPGVTPTFIAGIARLCGYDAYSGEWSFGEAVSIEAKGGAWQTVDLGSLNLPFDGWHRDATPASMYSILGVAITQATNSAKTWDINVLIPAPVEGGGRDFTPVVGQRFNCFDTRYIDSELYSQGPAAGANYMAGARRRTRGDLMTLKVGTNNLLINASDSSAPDNCSSIDLTRLTTVHRLKNGAP